MAFLSTKQNTKATEPSPKFTLRCQKACKCRYIRNSYSGRHAFSFPAGVFLGGCNPPRK
jgi:hypothetical protein